MSTYVILSRLSPGAANEPSQFRRLAEKVAERIKAECPNVEWKDSYALMGRYDVLDVVEADEPTEVEKAAMILRAEAGETTETMPATPWKEFTSAF